MTAEEIIAALNALANPVNVAGMSRFGIAPKHPLGVSHPELHALARRIGRDHALARELWRSGIHEARILAAYIDEPAKVTPAQMERWVRDFDTWDLCDQITGHLFDRTPHAHAKIREWSQRREEFVKRAAFALLAWVGVHDKHSDDGVFLGFFPLIEEAACDNRNYVKKAVNWALRQIGKRNPALHAAAIVTAERILVLDSPAARWIARDALRELHSPKVCIRRRARS